jgi:branched-subunit amino acid transport protein
MTAVLGDWQSYALLVLAGFLPNEIWRALGFLLGRRIDESSEVLVWVRAVATAILAGVIAQILVTPPGALAAVPALLRLGAVVAGFAAYLLIRRSLLAGVIAGEAVLVSGAWWLGLA